MVHRIGGLRLLNARTLRNALQPPLRAPFSFPKPESLIKNSE